VSPASRCSSAVSHSGWALRPKTPKTPTWDDEHYGEGDLDDEANDPDAVPGNFNGLRKRREAMTDSSDVKNTAKPLLKGLGKKVLHSVRAAAGTRFERRDFEAELERIMMDPQEIAERRRNEQEATEHFRSNMDRLRSLREDLVEKPKRGRKKNKQQQKHEGQERHLEPSAAPAQKRDQDETHCARAKQQAAKGDWQATLKEASRTIDANPHAVEAHLLQAKALRHLGSLPEAAAAYILAMGAGVENEKLQDDWDVCIDEIRHARGFWSPPVKVEAIFDPDNQKGWKRGARGTEVQIRTDRSTGRLPKAPLLSATNLTSTAVVMEWQLQEEPEFWAELAHMEPERLEPIFKFTLQMSTFIIKYDLTAKEFKEGWAPGFSTELAPPRPKGRKYETEGVQEWETIAELPETEFKSKVRNLEANMTYRMRLCSTNLHGNSDWSTDYIVETPQPWTGQKRGKKIPPSWSKKIRRATSSRRCLA